MSNRSLTAPILLLILLLVSACGSSKGDLAVQGAAPQAASMPEAPRASPSEADEVGVLSEGDLDFADTQRKLIINADLSLDVEDARAAAAQAQNLAAAHRGYVADSRLHGADDSRWVAMLTIRIPVTQFGSAYTAFKELGVVRDERQWSGDVTEEYIDLEARLKILSRHEATLLELQTKASSFDEWERVTHRLNETRIQIEGITGRLRLLDNQISYSTINLNLRQVPPALAGGATNWGAFGQRLGTAFSTSARAVWSFTEVLVMILVASPPVLILLAVLGAIWTAARRLVRRWRPARPDTPNKD